MLCRGFMRILGQRPTSWKVRNLVPYDQMGLPLERQKGGPKNASPGILVLEAGTKPLKNPNKWHQKVV